MAQERVDRVSGWLEIQPRLWAPKSGVSLHHSTRLRTQIDLPFSEDVTTLAELESVALGVDIVPVVVDSV